MQAQRDYQLAMRTNDTAEVRRRLALSKAITGDRAGMRRQAEEIARQLSRAGVPTVAVGDVPGVAELADRTVASLRELADASDAGQLLVVFLREQPSTDPALLHELVRRRPRVVPVSIGPGPRSRWWMDVA